MKKIILLSIAFFTITVSFAQRAITNKDIILMKTGKMTDDVILAKINSSKCNFDLTTAGLTDLKNAKISDNVVKQMFQASPPKETITNDDILAMCQSSISTAIIKTKMDFTNHNFDVSPEALIKLTTAKVPKDIIKEMIANPNGKGQASSNKSKSENSNIVSKSSSDKVLKYNEVANASIWKTYDEYVTKNGRVLKKGQKITLKFPSKEKSFQYVFTEKLLSTNSYFLDARYSNTELEIIFIKIDNGGGILGNKKFKIAQVVTSGADLTESIYIDIENALASGEVK